MDKTIYNEKIKYFAPAREPRPFNIEMTGISYCDGSYRIVRILEQSDVFVMEYILQGEGTILVNGKEYHPQEGDFYLLQPGIPHEYFSDAQNPWVKVFMNLYGPLCQKVIDVYGLSNTVLIKGCDVKDLFESFLQIANDQDLSEVTILNQCAGKFVEIIAKASTQMGTQASLHSEEAFKLKQYIDRNTHRFVSVTELADSIYRSRDYTAKLFKAEYNVTPYEYQIVHKVEICRRLLCTSTIPIRAIAQSLGYTDQQYFSRLFHTRCGVSPRKFREMHRQHALEEASVSFQTDAKDSTQISTETEGTS